MSKIATYLNEHMTGQVVTSGRDIDAVSTDGGIVLEKPEMVAYVASTSDIRKIARFCWQLAEKGHTLSLTVRGHGANATGAALSSGIVLSQTRYMHRIVGIDPKQRFIHVQAGAPYIGVNMALSTHRGMTLPQSSFDGQDGTVGGAIASGAAGFLSARYGTVASAVKQLEVVLANGDVLQTGRISKRELNAKKGLHTMEGEIYRQIDNLISDNQELIQTLSRGPRQDTVGYRSIASLKKKDGSIDLTPLFVGSQGTLGIVTEAIMQAQYAPQSVSVVRAAYENVADAQAAADVAVAAKASAVHIIDGRVMKSAAEQGRKRDFAPEKSYGGALMVAIFNDFAERTRQRASKKLQRDLGKGATPLHISLRNHPIAELADLYSSLSLATSPRERSMIVSGVFQGIWLPTVQFDSLLGELKKVEAEYSVKLPFSMDMASGFLDLLPVFDMKKVSDRQKLLKVATKLAQLVHTQGGTIAGHGGDGRLKGLALQGVLGDDETTLYEQIKTIFDPHGVLNPGVKQKLSPKDVAAQINAWCRTLL